jgi:hypothetical protein
VRSLSIQVQPERSSGLDVERLSAAFADIAVMEDLVQHHHFDRGEDKGPYLNFTFGTLRAAELWRHIRTRLYEDDDFGPHLRAASMALCSSEEGWDDYFLLYHFDATVSLDGDSTL